MAGATAKARKARNAGRKAGRVRAYGSTTTVRPKSVKGGKAQKRIRLIAARNEFESFQLRIQAKRKLKRVRVSLAGPLKGPHGAQIDEDDVTLYRAATYQVKASAGKPRSSRQGAQGLWPDALIPEIDPYYHEDRAAFPMLIKRGGSRLVWGDVFVDRGLPPGTYKGAVKVGSARGLVGRVPIKVIVIDHTMPSTSSLRSAFLNTPPGYVPCRAHWAVDWCYQEADRNWRLAYLYTRAALENRVTIPNLVPGGFDQPPDPAKFREYVLPLIDGDDAGGIAGTAPPRLRGARLTSVVAMWQCIVAGNGCLAEWRRLANNHGFADRFISYVCDEPTLQSQPEYWNDWADCRDNSALARQRFPESKTLVTAWIQNARQAEREKLVAVERDIDLIAPLVNYLANRPGNPQAGNQRPAYNDFLGSSPRKEMWAYTACPQFSCDEFQAPYFDGWPAYAITSRPRSRGRWAGSPTTTASTANSTTTSRWRCGPRGRTSTAGAATATARCSTPAPRRASAARPRSAASTTSRSSRCASSASGTGARTTSSCAPPREAARTARTRSRPPCATPSAAATARCTPPRSRSAR